MSAFSGKAWGKASTLKNMDQVMSCLLDRRDLVTHEVITAFLHPKIQDLHDPFLMHSMDKAVARILLAIENQEKIMVYGDFDADGITSTVILVDGLKKLGALVSYRIPDRNTDGHGLKDYILEEIADKGVSLVISCDCGINDKKQVEKAVSLGMEVIISDHHDPERENFPDQALAVLNPHCDHCNYPTKNLSGAGIAFKIVTALVQETFEDPQALSRFLTPYLEIAAIGLIADCIPLLGEARTITRFGLTKMKQTSWEGLDKLFEKNSIDPQNIDAETIGFYVAPRLNAASRLGDVMRSAALFLGNSDQHYERLTYLESLNNKRRVLTEQHIKSAESKIEPSAPCQFLSDKDWTIGILGLMGSSLSETWNCPIFAGKERADGIGCFSARAPEGSSIIQGLRHCDKNLFLGFGGHNGAGGFQAKIENLKTIKTQLCDYYAKTPPKEVLVNIEAFVDPSIINFELTDFLNLLGPFGMGNPAPNLGLLGIKIMDKKFLGKKEDHIRLVGSVGDKEFSFIGFFMGHFASRIKIGEPYDIVFTLAENYWQGARRLQLKLVDLRLSR